MKKLFVSIRRGKLEEVKRILDKKPELISCTATAPPKKDVGQSPLQVAIKSDNAEVANYLLDIGADVNFMEEKVYYEMDLRAPILYDAIVQVYLGWSSSTWYERSEKYLALVSRLLELGADPNKKDSHGESSWNWVLNQYDGFVSETDDKSRYDYELMTEKNNRYLELASRLFEKITAYGADIYNMPNCFFLSGMKTMRGAIFNLIRNRDIMEGLTFDGELFEARARYKWNLIEPVLRPYYAKDNPYYGAEISGERKQLFEKLDDMMCNEEQYERAAFEDLTEKLKKRRELESGT